MVRETVPPDTPRTYLKMKTYLRYAYIHHVKIGSGEPHEL